MTDAAAPAPAAQPTVPQPTPPPPNAQRGSSMRQALAARDAGAEQAAEVEEFAPPPRVPPRQRPAPRAPEPEPPANEALGDEGLDAAELDPALDPDADPDQQEAEADALEKLYFGDVKGGDLLAALESGVISRELFQKLGELALEWEEEGEDGRKSMRKMALKDVPRSGMRQADYSKKTAEIARLRDEAGQHIERAKRLETGLRARDQAWMQDPLAMYRDLRRSGHGKSLLQVGAMLAERYDKAAKMPGREGEFFLKQLEHDEADEDRKWHEQRTQQTRQQQAQQQRLQQIRQQTQEAYRRFVPTAVESAGLNLKSKAVRHFLGQNLDAVQGELTQQAVADAVAATVQDLDDFVAHHGDKAAAAVERLPANGAGGARPAASAQQRPVTAARQAQQQQAPRGLPPGRLPGGGPAAQRPAQGQRGSIKSFQQKFLKRGNG